MKKIIKLAALSSALLISSVQADEASIRQALGVSMPALEIDAVKPSEIDGLYEVTVGSNIFYVSDDGKYLVQGHVIDIAARKDLTENKLAGNRVAAIEELGEEQTIIFKPENSRYKVSVFTDIDCGYCRKLHSELDQYMAEGITIQYLFFPRAGKGSDSYKKAISVWCADDRNAALTSAKQGNEPEAKTCDNPVDEHMQLGAEFEARGTPMIVTEKGNIFPGYVPAKQLARALAAE
ncbi:DsbC family protein [Methylomarinum sp. Ch1-1]|uniref:Thiol:disulfide interchange protein n=1 Tax=Methylomarinum roseum TaxID=3067653 RepID=A0AAU7NPQ5_9GAMM|nr:DsbC family protein [Methylomarinum sp. Ch1-1]MDP4521157.1 DsbC family protein [Methylomarinum sp. Ch1-1]